MKRCVFILLTFMLLMANLYSQTVSVLCYADLDTQVVEVKELMTNLSTGCMDTLFNEGFIATSDVLGLISKTDFDTYITNYDKSALELVDYAIVIHLSFKLDSDKKAVLKPELIQYNFVDIIKKKNLLKENALINKEIIDSNSSNSKSEQGKNVMHSFGTKIAKDFIALLAK